MDVGKSCTGNISRTGVQKCILFQEQSSGYRKKEQDRQNDHLAFRDTEHDAEITLVKRYGRQSAFWRFCVRRQTAVPTDSAVHFRRHPKPPPLPHLHKLHGGRESTGRLTLIMYA